MNIAVSTPNPFREGTKLHRIFEYMKDGEYHTLGQINGAAYPIYLQDFPLLSVRRRRTGSALRTIRATSIVYVIWDGVKSYKLRDLPT